MFNKQVFYL